MVATKRRRRTSSKPATKILARIDEGPDQLGGPGLLSGRSHCGLFRHHQIATIKTLAHVAWPT